MSREETATRIDRLFSVACAGDEVAFEAWLVEVEPALHRSLAPWARAVDVESVVQEALLRVWIFARERGDILEGENASLRWTIGVARNVARNEARRFGREQLVPTDELPQVAVEPEPSPDPALGRLIRRCFEKLSGRQAEAMRARVDRGHLEDDRSLAGALGMSVNAFLQNVVRARKKLAACLAEHGAPLEELLP